MTLVAELPLRGARTIRLTERGAKLRIEAVAGTVGAGVRAALTKTVAHMLRLDEDLSGFYTLVGADSELAWCAAVPG